MHEIIIYSEDSPGFPAQTKMKKKKNLLQLVDGFKKGRRMKNNYNNKVYPYTLVKDMQRLRFKNVMPFITSQGEWGYTVKLTKHVQGLHSGKNSESNVKGSGNRERNRVHRSEDSA